MNGDGPSKELFRFVKALDSFEKVGKAEQGRGVGWIHRQRLLEQLLSAKEVFC